MRLPGAHALITGGSKGLGALLAADLIARGCRVTLVARQSTQLEKTAADLGCAHLAADLSDPGSHTGLVRRAEELNGPVEVLVNNAGAGVTKHFGDLTATELRGAMTLNLLAPMELSRQVVPAMVGRGRGIIANVSSLAGEMAVPHVAAYGTSKAGLMMHTLTLRRDLAGSGVNTVSFVIGGVAGTGVYDEGTTSPVTSAVGARFNKLSKKQLTPEGVAATMARALARGRNADVVIPRSATPLVQLHLLPNRIGGLLFAGIDPGAPATH